MAWPLLKSVAKETLGCRTLALAAIAALIAAIALAAAGVGLVYLALRDFSRSERYRYSIMTVAGAAYAVLGAIAGAQTVMSQAMCRALRALHPTLHPLAARAASAALRDVSPNAEGIEIARVEQLVDSIFDQMKATADLPIVRHIVGVAAAVGRWHVRRRLDPILAPLRQSGQTHINRQVLESALADAACDALIGAAVAQVVRTRIIIWSLPAIALLVPLLILAWRTFKGS